MFSFNTLRLYLWETIVFFRYALFPNPKHSREAAGQGTRDGGLCVS